MDKLIIDIKYLAIIITALGGWKLMNYLLNRHTINRLTAAEAMQRELEAVMTDYKRMQEKVEKLDRKVDELRRQVLRLQDERLELTRENGELKVKLREAESMMCLRPPESCRMRISPAMRSKETIYSDNDTLKPDNDEEDTGLHEEPDQGRDAGQQ